MTRDEYKKYYTMARQIISTCGYSDDIIWQIRAHILPDPTIEKDKLINTMEAFLSTYKDVGYIKPLKNRYAHYLFFGVFTINTPNLYRNLYILDNIQHRVLREENSHIS